MSAGRHSDKLPIKKLRPFFGVAAAVVAAVVTTAFVVPSASAGSSSTPAPLTAQAWHNDIAQLATPGKGCYTASYPTLTWRSVTCTTAPNLRFTPSAGAQGTGGAATRVHVPAGRGGTSARPDQVGNGVDYSARVTGLLTGATGSFPTVSGVTSETGGGVANSYSLQLNSAPFTSPVCAGRGASCQGWEQFILSNPGSSAGSIFIQFWILNYDATCPAGWFTYGGDCYRNGPAVGVPSQPITSLGHLSLTGSVTSTSDTTVLTTATTSYSVVAPDSVLTLSAQWNTVEFMIGGDGGGSQAVFNAGSTIIVQTATHNGTTNAPTCIEEGFTGETNNLNLVSTPAFPPGPSPAIHSQQSNILTTTPSCASGHGIGDTHLETFGGTFYDFQAEGTFTLAQSPTMTVQNEQVSGAPTWPNAAVNAAVGTQMGADQVALCLSGSVYVDGLATTIPSGQVSTLASGDQISHVGDVYVVTDPQGDSLTATMNGSYINAEVGLGQYPEAVSGLLANAPGTDNELETSSGQVLTTPVDMQTLYGVYGDSWRVQPSASLVAICSDPTQNQDPPTPFWADSLPQNEQTQGETVCKQDGVTDATLLEACTLDVVVLGDAAATTYEGEPAPVDVGFSEDTSGSSQSPSPSPSTTIGSGSPSAFPSQTVTK